MLDEDEDEAVIVFPEGVRGTGKGWDKRYQLQRYFQALRITEEIIRHKKTGIFRACENGGKSEWHWEAGAVTVYPKGCCDNLHFTVFLNK
ncbi:MAG: hypothetical protein WBJ03_13885 [Moraxellaceae bacterium]